MALPEHQTKKHLHRSIPGSFSIVQTWNEHDECLRKEEFDSERLVLFGFWIVVMGGGTSLELLLARKRSRETAARQPGLGLVGVACLPFSMQSWLIWTLLFLRDFSQGVVTMPWKKVSAALWI